MVLSRLRNVRFMVSGVPKPQVLAICSMVLLVVSSSRQADSSRTAYVANNANDLGIELLTDRG